VLGKGENRLMWLRHHNKGGCWWAESGMERMIGGDMFCALALWGDGSHVVYQWNWGRLIPDISV
jgi:hypothetical protein